MRKWGTRSLFENCLGHTGKQLRRILEISTRSAYHQPQREHEAAQLPKLSQDYKLAPNKLRLEGRLQDEHSIQRDRLLLVTQHRPSQAFQAAQGC